MELSINVNLLHKPITTERFLGALKSLYRVAIQRKDGRAKPKIEEPDEENMDYDGIMPGREGTPDTGAEPEKENPGDPDHADVSVPEDPSSQATYSGESEEALPSDITGPEEERSQEDKKPEREEDISKRLAEEDVAHQAEEDKNDEDERSEGDKKPEREEDISKRLAEEDVAHQAEEDQNDEDEDKD